MGKRKEVKAGAERAKVILSRGSTQNITPFCQAKQSRSGKRIMGMKASLGGYLQDSKAQITARIFDGRNAAKGKEEG